MLRILTAVGICLLAISAVAQDVSIDPFSTRVIEEDPGWIGAEFADAPAAPTPWFAYLQYVNTRSASLGTVSMGYAGGPKKTPWQVRGQFQRIDPNASDRLDAYGLEARASFKKERWGATATGAWDQTRDVSTKASLALGGEYSLTKTVYVGGSAGFARKDPKAGTATEDVIPKLKLGYFAVPSPDRKNLIQRLGAEIEYTFDNDVDRTHGYSLATVVALPRDTSLMVVIGRDNLVLVRLNRRFGI
jgi:hypothetical protein